MAALPITPASSQGMVFDSTPVSASTPQASTSASNIGAMVFDSAPTKQAISVPFTLPKPAQTASAPVRTSDEITAKPGDSFAAKTGKVAGGFLEGIGEGAFGTVAGASDIFDKATGLQPGAPNAELHTLAGDNNASHGAAQSLGIGAESLGEFLMGDSALKGLALSDKLLSSARAAKVIESSPLLSKVVALGINALRAAGVQGGIATVKSEGNLTQGAEQGAIAGGATVALGTAGMTYTAIRSALDAGALQQPLQNGVRTILSDAAAKAGVPAPASASIRDAAQQVSDSVKAKASQLYQTLDTVSGGQAQRFRDAAQNVSDQLRSIVGLDDEKEAELTVKQADIDKAHKAMLDRLQAAGHDPNMLAQADATWKQQAALSDLSNAVRQSTTGLRPELAEGATGATTPEALSPRILFTKINRLNDRGRLAQAIGQDNANALLQHVDQAYVQAQKIAARSKFAGALARVATTAGLGGLGYEAVHLAHGLLDGQ